MSTTQALRERGELLDELRQIVQAMKHLAYAQLQRVGRVRAAQVQARDAVQQALATLPSTDGTVAVTRRTWLVIGAERGLCGAFNARLAQEIPALRGTAPAARVLVASRPLLALVPSHPGIELLPGCAGLEETEQTLDEWLPRIAHEAANGREVWLMHAAETGLVRQRLSPPTACVAPQRKALDVPLHYLPIPTLRDALAEQLLRLGVQAGLLESLQQENHWRLAQMQRAQDHLDDLSRTLRGQLARMRQADITNELETLVSSLSAGPSGRSHTSS